MYDLLDVSLNDYRQAVASGDDITFTCPTCTTTSLSRDASFAAANAASGTSSHEASFNCTDIPFDVTGGFVEEDMQPSDSGELERSLPEDGGPTFTMVDAGTKRNRAKLVDNSGYSYTVKKKYVILSY